MCELCTLFNSDKPFRFHRPDDLTKGVLVGKKATKYLDLFDREVYPLAMKNPVMTAVIGLPGSGKTQLLNHLESTQREKSRICIILNLDDIQVDYDYLVNSLIGSDSFRKFLNIYGYSLQYKNSIKEKVVETRELINKIRAENGNEKIGICFLVDSVDEYIRKIKDKTIKERQEIIRDLMVITSELLDDLQHTCTIFAITNDVYQEFKKVLESDDFLKEKFLFILDEDNSTKEKKDLTLEKLDEEENEKMVSAFLDLWAQRNEITLPESKETTNSSGRNLFPYTRDAINIFWNAGAIPGDTCLACLSALDRKLSLAQISDDPSHLIITEVDAAWTVNQFSGYFYYEQTDFEKRINSLLSGSRLDFEMKNIISMAKSSYFDCSDLLPEAFKNYLEALKGFSVKSGDIRKFTKYKYDLDKDFDIIDLIVDFKMKKIGLQFIVKQDGKELNKGKIYEKVKSLLSALKNKQIERGIVVIVSDTENEEIQISDLLKNHYERKTNVPFKEYRNFAHKNDQLFQVDYFPTIFVGKISEYYAWCLLGLYTFIKSSNNSANNLMEKYSNHIEEIIMVRSMFEQVLKRETKTTCVTLNTPTMKTLLYR